MRFALLCLCLLTLGAAAQAAPSPIVRPLASAEKPAAYGVAEWTIDPGQLYANPYDPAEIAIDAAFAGPGGRRISLPAFWYQGYRRVTQADGGEGLTAEGQPEWRVRFCPPSAGAWRMTVTARDASGSRSSSPVAFTVARSDNPGFVRRAPNSDRYFQYDSGAPYFIVGLNVCWAGKGGLRDYETWFPALGKAGGNFARIWMGLARPIEHKPTGLGRYDQANAFYYDGILELADRNGLRCMFALGTYSEFTTGGYFNEGRWPVNPYNKANGGPAEKPEDFFTEPLAREYYKRRLRYLIGRYGARTSMAFWEFWNEKDAPAPWVAEMAAYLKANDPYRRPVTNSYTVTGKPEVWNLKDIDLTQVHRYGDEGSIRDMAPIIAAYTRDHDVYKKPHLMGEFGISWRGSDTKFDPNATGVNFHNGLWSGALSGGAGGGALWWWDNYVQPRNLWGTFTGLSRFAATVDWPKRRFEPLAVPAPTLPPTETETFRDLVLSPQGAWGDRPTGDVIIGQDGTTGGGKVLSHLFGPLKKDLQAPLTLIVNLPKPSSLVMRIGTVSIESTLRVTVDGKTAAEFPFVAAPTGPGGYESTKQFPEYGGIYQAVFNKDREVPLPAGKHTITLENVAGDWMDIRSYILKDALSSRFTLLRTLALQDAATGESLLWLQDPESNWYNDREGIAPRAFDGVRLSLPVTKSGAYEVAWWDTRRGEIVRTDRAEAKAGALALSVPAFTRDIALRAVRR